MNFALPHIVEQLEDFPPGEYDGEVYAYSLTHQEILSRAKRTVEPHPEAHQLSLVVFDLPSYDSLQVLRIDRLESTFAKLGHNTGRVLCCQTQRCVTLDQVHEYLSACLTLGYEGMIVRNPEGRYVRKRSVDILKIKPRKSDTYSIVGSVEELSQYGEPKGTLGALRVIDEDGREFKVGTGFTAAERWSLWERRTELVGKRVVVKYQNLTDGKIPRFPVFCEVVE